MPDLDRKAAHKVARSGFFAWLIQHRIPSQHVFAHQQADLAAQRAEPPGELVELVPKALVRYRMDFAAPPGLKY